MYAPTLEDVSSLFLFERLFDTPQQIEREERDKRMDLAGARDVDGDPPTLRCRVCAHEGPERHYCPTCLSDTMRPFRRAKDVKPR